MKTTGNVRRGSRAVHNDFLMCGLCLGLSLGLCLLSLAGGAAAADIAGGADYPEITTTNYTYSAEGRTLSRIQERGTDMDGLWTGSRTTVPAVGGTTTRTATS